MFKLLTRMVAVAAFAAAPFFMPSASAAEPAGPTPAAVAAKLKELYPQRTWGAVAHSPIPGLYEVVTGDSLSYVDASGKYLLYGGQLIDFQRQVNLTEQRLGEINRIDPSLLNVADAIKMVKGRGERVLYVFADPQCTFCKRLENDLATMDNVTVYTFLYPILNGSRPKAEHVWCAADRLKSWEDQMLRGTAPLPATCDNPLERNLALGQRFRVTGTPTMFSTDGRRLSGAVGVQAINTFLAAPAKVATR